MKVLQKESLNADSQGVLWTFYVPFFSSIELSNYYDTFCRYISVSYIRIFGVVATKQAGREIFVRWFEKGDNI